MIPLRLFFLAFLSSWALDAATPRNVILFIGDGMGAAQVQAASVTLGLANTAQPAQVAETKLCFENFPVCGTVATSSASSFITDSAAAGTALAGGEKTNNGAIGVRPDGTSVSSVAEIAKANGKAVGILSSVGFDHATPACFYAHTASRNSMEEIVESAWNSSLDILFGGGVCAKEWDEAKLKTAAAAKVGWQCVDAASLATLTPERAGNAKLIGSFDLNNNDQLDFAASRHADNREPRLVDLTLAALPILAERGKNGNGFFLMVEGGTIDWACHNNDGPNVVGEVLELHETVRATLAFLAKNNLLADTLVVVTADHETGGMSLKGPYGKPLQTANLLEFGWTSGNHTAIPVPLWATGPGAELFAGKQDNSAVGQLLKRLVTSAP